MSCTATTCLCFLLFDCYVCAVSDRLAYLNYVHGSLAGTLAGHLDKAREAMKELRDAERALEPKRNIRTNLRTQIARIEHDQQRGMERRLAELKQQLDRAEAEDLAAEKELEVRKRTSLASSEKAKWAALREVKCLFFDAK